MISSEQLLRVVLGEVVAVALLLLVYFGHAALESRRVRRLARLAPRVRAALMDYVQDPAAPVPDVLQELRLREQIHLLLEFARPLTGESRRRLGEAARHIGLVELARRHCRSSLWWRRLRAARLLTVFGGGEEEMPALLRDRDPVVRAQAAEWAAEHPSPEVLTALMELLRDPNSLCRFSVRDALLRSHAAAQAPLAEFLARMPEDEAADALDVAAGMAAPAFLEPALRLARAGSPRVRARAARLLGVLGAEQATDALTSLLADPAPEVRAAAASGVARAAHWPAAAALARLLDDPVWEVRRCAAQALRQLGAPGLLYLRRSLRSPDATTAGLARQMLELAGELRPEGAR